MNSYIVYEPSSKIREIAREALRGNWLTVFWGALIFAVLSTFVSSLLDEFFGIIKYVPFGERYLRISVSYAGSLYEYLVMGALICGFSMFMLAFFRTKKANYALTLEGFSMYGKAFCLYLLYSLKIFLWGLLLVVPGIVAMYRYSQCFYLRVDHPEWTAFQCIDESKRLMRGNKGKLFCLGLSFIGWMILAAIPQSIFINVSDLSGIAYFIINLILWIPVLVVNLYIDTAKVVFYEILNGNLVVVNPQGIPYGQYGREEQRRNGNESDGGEDKGRD